MRCNVRFLFLIFCLFNFSYCSVISNAIDKQTEAVNTVKGINDNQNNEIKSKIAVKKRKVLELRNSVFLIKQRNELILNYFYLDSLFLKD